MPRVSTKQDTKVALLEAGTEIMQEKGYTNTGIQEVLSTLGVPKGSFYHYFESKEDFALEIIRHMDQAYTASLMRTLRNPSLSPLERLRLYCQSSKENLADAHCRKGCLIGNLSQEMADQSEVLRCELASIMKKRKEMFAACIEEGQQLGEISNNFCPSKMAVLFCAGWNGAVLAAKTFKSVEPLDAFMDIMFDHVLKA
jgi:Transcriptional regulator